MATHRRALRTARFRSGRIWTSIVSATLVLLMANSAWAITLDNVIQMHQSKLPASVIVQTIQSTGSTFTLTPADKKRLEDAGVDAAVIDAMVASSGAGGAPAPEPPPEPAVEIDPLEKMKADEDAAKSKIEDESRIEAAQRRAADIERQKMQAEERKRVALALKQANEALGDRKYYRAIKEFDRFIQQAEPGKPSTDRARLGFAKALQGLGLYGNAAGIFEDLLGNGSESDLFEPAFEGLRACSRSISYNPVTLESLTNHFVGNFDQGFQDSYNYFLGKFFFDYTRYDDARKYLGEVKDGALDYADAQYLLGLTNVLEAGEEGTAEWAQKLISGTQFFQGAVNAAEEQGQDRIEHLAYLALARIAYSLGSFDAAIYYYRKVPSDSTSYVDALLESGWSYFLKGDVARGMGIFHTLDGPSWVNYYIPDTYLLEATVFMNRCHFRWARESMDRIKTKFLALKAPLTQFMTEYASPESLYKAFVLEQTRKGVELPRLLRMAVISNSEFYDLYTTVTRYRREVARIKRSSDRFGQDLANRLLDTVESRQKEGAIALGIKINQLLQELDDGLTDLEIQMTEISIEIDEVEANEINAEIEGVLRVTTEKDEEAESQATATVLVGNKYLNWPFEGEYWADEINSYRSDLKGVCKQ
ncbi:MAG: hypothetical protein ACI9U2_001577 [Bradymonadia bacterium]|jgi:hypothetical protein